MRHFKIHIANVLLCTLLLSCTSRSLSAEEYLKYCMDPDNGLRVEKEVKDLKFSLQYQPQEMMNIGNLSSNKATSNSSSDQGRMIHFLLKIEAINGQTDPLKVGVAGKDEYYYRIEYLSFQVSKDLKLFQGNDTFQCELAHLERMYNIAPYVTLDLVFEKKKPRNGSGKKDINDIYFVYFDKIFNTGTIRFIISGNDLKKIPTLKLI